MLYRIIHPHIFPETYKMRHCRILKHAYSTGHNLLHKFIVGFHSSPGISNVCRKLGQHLLVARGQLLVVVLKTLYSYQCICPGEYDMDACVCVCVYTHGRGVYCLWQLHPQTSNPSENCPHLGCFCVELTIITGCSRMQIHGRPGLSSIILLGFIYGLINCPEIYE